MNREYVGHLMRLPTQRGHVLVDPEAVLSLSPHRKLEGQCCLTEKGSQEVHYIRADYEEVEAWLAEELG